MITDSTDNPLDPDFMSGERELTADIQAEVLVPSGQKGEASVVWDVPESASTAMTVAGSDGGFSYDLMVSAYGIVSASASKEAAAGHAYSIAQIHSRAHASWAGSVLIPPAVAGETLIMSASFLTGTGSTSAAADGSASYMASLDTDADVDSEPDLMAEGSVAGLATLDAVNENGGTILGVIFDLDAFSVYLAPLHIPGWGR